MKTSISLKFDTKDLEKKLNKTLLTKNNAKKIIYLCCTNLQRDIQQSLSLGGTGRTYKKYTPHKREHTASAQGRPPALDLGDLRKGIVIDPIKERMNIIEGGVRSTEFYSLWLEYGTNNDRIKARPFMQPAFKRQKNKILKKFKTELF